MTKTIVPVSLKLFLGFFVLITSFLILIAAFVNTTYAEVLRENEVKYNLLVNNKTKSQFDFTISLIQNTTSSLSNNAYIQKLLTDIENNELPDTQNIAEINSLLSGVLEIQSYMENVHVVTLGSEVYSAVPTPNQPQLIKSYQEYFQKAMDGESIEFWSGGNIYPLSYIKPIFQTNPRRVVGLLVLDINYEFVREMFMASAIDANERVMIVNPEGQIIFNFPYTISYTPLIEQYPEILQHDKLQMEANVYGQESIIVTETLNMSNWKIVRLISIDDFTKDTKRLGLILRNLLIISFIAGLLYSLWLLNFITKPIRKLAEACKRVEQGDLSTRVDIQSRDEFGSLGKSFNMMISQIRQSLEKEICDEKRKTQMQFQILQAQVNPHFLYNILDSIRWMAAMQNASNIAEMSTALISLLKYNLASLDAKTTLQDEVESVRHYIRIQKFRYSDNFDYSDRLDPDTLRCQVLRFILQPLVENCIIHGFEDVERSYQMRISSFIDDDTLHIKVIDNGSGMTPERIQAVNEGLNKDKRYNHIGVQNIRERIKLHFGDTYDLVYSSEPDVGTIAEIVLPYIPEVPQDGPDTVIGEDITK